MFCLRTTQEQRQYLYRGHLKKGQSLQHLALLITYSPRHDAQWLSASWSTNSDFNTIGSIIALKKQLRIQTFKVNSSAKAVPRKVMCNSGMNWCFTHLEKSWTEYFMYLIQSPCAPCHHCPCLLQSHHLKRYSELVWIRLNRNTIT